MSKDMSLTPTVGQKASLTNRGKEKIKEEDIYSSRGPKKYFPSSFLSSLILFLPTVSHKFLDSSFLFSLPETTHGWLKNRMKRKKEK